MNKLVLKDRVINEILYDICYNITEEDKKKFPLKYRRILNSQAKTKTFCSKSSLDEKIIFLSYIGVEFSITFFPSKTDSHLKLKKIVESHYFDKKAAAQKQQAGINVYVATDKQFKYIMSVMGQTIADETYIKALDFNKVGYSTKDWDKHLNDPEQNKINEVYENADLVIETILTGNLVNMQAVQHLGITPLQLNILLYLFLKRNTYVTRERILSRFMETTTIAVVKRHMNKILVGDLVRRNVDWRKGEYTITAAGIKLVSDYMAIIFNSNKNL